MKVLRLIITALFLVSAVACGTTTEEPIKKNTTPVDNTNTDDTNTDDTNTDTNDNNNNNTPDDQYARQICERIQSCLSEMTCTQPVQMDIDACVTSLMSQGVDAQAANYYQNLACDEINKSQCGNSPQLQEMCECPSSPQGSCNDGLFCSVALSTQTGETLYACGTEMGGIPTDAPTCNQSTPCVEGTDCIATTADGSTGSCMTMCDL